MIHLFITKGSTGRLRGLAFVAVGLAFAPCFGCAGQEWSALETEFQKITKLKGQQYEGARAAIIARQGVRGFLRGVLAQKKSSLSSRLHAAILLGWIDNGDIYRTLNGELKNACSSETADGQLVWEGLYSVVESFDTKIGRPFLYERLLKYAPKDISPRELLEDAFFRRDNERERRTQLEWQSLWSRFRIWTVQMLSRGELRDDSFLTFVLSTIADREKDSCRLQAIVSLGTRKTSSAVPVLLRILSEERNSLPARTACLRSLIEIGDPVIAEKTKRLFAEFNAPELRILAIEAIGKQGRASDIVWLKELLSKERERDLRESVNNAIKCIREREAKKRRKRADSRE